MALVSPSHSDHRPSAATVAACCQSLVRIGVQRVVTPALAEPDAIPYLEAGFTHSETLHLLVKTLTSHPPALDHSTRPGRFWHLERVLEIDHLAFDDFWRFDSAALNEARSATPYSRFRVAKVGLVIAGYHVTGRAGSRGYLQRIAVDPELAGRGVGTSLVNDCLAWLYEHSVSEVLVNTQQSNHRALDLYERMGFVRQSKGLSVLTWNEAS